LILGRKAHFEFIAGPIELKIAFERLSSLRKEASGPIPHDGHPILVRATHEGKQQEERDQKAHDR